MKYFFMKNNQRYEFTSFKEAVQTYSDKPIFFRAYRRFRAIEGKQYPFDVTTLCEEALETYNPVKFSYKGKIFDTAKECYEYFNIPESRRYTHRYYKTKVTKDNIIKLDYSIDAEVYKKESKDFEYYLKELTKWYKHYTRDPRMTSKDKHERQLGLKVQNLRKAYKNYLLKQLGQEPITNHVINEKQIEALNKINFVWSKGKGNPKKQTQ